VAREIIIVITVMPTAIKTGVEPITTRVAIPAPAVLEGVDPLPDRDPDGPLVAAAPLPVEDVLEAEGVLVGVGVPNSCSELNVWQFELDRAVGV